MDSKGEWTAEVAAAYAAWNGRRQLFRGDHEVYFVTGAGQRQLYPYKKVNWLGDRLTRRIGELTFPGFPRLFAADAGQQALVKEWVRLLDVAARSYPSALVCSWGGAAAWKVYWSREAGGPAVTLWGAQEGEYCVFDFRAGDRASAYAANCWYETEVKGEDEVWRYRINERYERQGDGRILFTNRAWRVRGEYGLTQELVPVGLREALPDEPPPPRGWWPTSRMPVYSVPNVDLFGTGQGDSDYSESLVDIQKQVNAVVAQRAVVVALCGLPHFQVPRRLVRADGTLDLRDVWLEVEYEGQEVTPIKVTNWDGNLALTDQQLDRLDKEFMHCSILSPAVDGQTTGVGGESGYARRLSMTKLEAGIWRRRMPYEYLFEWLIQTAQELRNSRGGRRRRPEVDLSVLWPPPIPEDPESVGRTVESCMRVGAMSREAAVRRLNPTESDEWISSELERIEDDWRRAAEAGFRIGKVGRPAEATALAQEEEVEA